MIDFHSHILPRIDDGSKSSEMSVQMLEASYAYGVDTMVATPHFYITHNTAENFEKKRSESYEALKVRIAEYDKPLPDIILGAEVYYFRGISKYDFLDKLKIGNTNYLLLEMPFECWNERVLREVSEITEETGLIPVIAHIDRYIDLQKGTDNIDRLVSMDIPIQMNADYINGFFTRSKAIKLIKNGVVTLLGSDCHNMDSRRPNLGQALDILTKKCGADTVDTITSESRKLLGL
ncbi:MAG: capsular polysaccharide biosynthesis protein [Firmicutes bacterium]|nr:capsular polysaccharide biosynthesis protein [Bacillota bacterium]